MNTKIVFIILFLCFFTNYFAQEITLPEYPSARDVLPRVVFRISKDSSAFIYFYDVKNQSGAQQAIWKYMVQIQTVHFSINVPSGWRGSNISRDTIHAVTWHSLDSLNDIYEDSIQDSFNIISEALPNIAHFYAKGWIVIPEGEEVIKPGTNDVFYNSYKGITIGPVDSPDPFIHIEFIKTLISYADSSYELGWIQNHEIRDKYNTYFNNASNYLEQGDRSAARNELQIVLNECNSDSSSVLTSEAYALLRYNTEYLVEQLPAGVETIFKER